MDERTFFNANEPYVPETQEKQMQDHILAESFKLDNLNIDKLNNLEGKHRLMTK